MLEGLTNFLRHFFGPGKEDYSFPYFSFAHFLPILVMISIIYLIYHYRKEIRANETLDLKLRAWLGFIVSTANISWYWYAIYVGTDIRVSLPLTVCETVMMLSPYLLLTKSQHLFDVFYFWTLSGSTQALITPAVLDNYGPTQFKYYQFWTGHTGIVIVIFYCLFVLEMKINFKSMVRSIFWLLIMAIIAIYANSNIPGANYLFLAGSEAGSSILDILPTALAPRMAILTSLVILLFTIAYLPWYFINRKSQRQQDDQQLVTTIQTPTHA